MQTLNSDCPLCGAPLAHDNFTLFCTSDTAACAENLVHFARLNVSLETAIEFLRGRVALARRDGSGE
jgi:hypothetical protein